MNTKSEALALRSAIAAATAMVIVIGAVNIVRGGPPSSRGEFDVKFFSLVGAALLPSVVYLIGIRERRSALLYGLGLLGVTVFAWAFTFSDDAMRAVGTFPAFFVTLGIALAGVVHDRSETTRPSGGHTGGQRRT